MHTTHDHAHYMPHSVGALMDPGFLRRAVGDFNESEGVERDAGNDAASGWRSTYASAKAIVRRAFTHVEPPR
jgi:hypothetical protein